MPDKIYKTPNGTIVTASELRKEYKDKFNSVIKEDGFSEVKESVYKTPNGKLATASELKSEYKDKFASVIKEEGFSEVKKKESTVLPSEQIQESTTSVTPKVTEQKPSVSSSSKDENVFSGYPGKEAKKYKLVNNVWHESSSTLVPTVGIIPSVESNVKLADTWLPIQNEGRSKALNKYFKKDAYTSMQDKSIRKIEKKLSENLGTEKVSVSSDMAATSSPLELQLVNAKTPIEKKEVQAKIQVRDVNRHLTEQDNLNKQKFDINVANTVNSNLIAGDEVDAVEVLNSKFNKDGFLFEEGSGDQIIAKYSPDGGFTITNSETINLDAFKDATDMAESLKLQNFMKNSRLSIDEIKNISEVKGKNDDEVRANFQKIQEKRIKLMAEHPEKYGHDLISEDEAGRFIDSKNLDLKVASKKLNDDYAKLALEIEDYNANPTPEKRLALKNKQNELLFREHDIQSGYGELNKIEESLNKSIGHYIAKSEKHGNILGNIAGGLVKGAGAINKTMLTESINALPILDYVLSGSKLQDNPTNRKLKELGKTDVEILDLQSKEMQREIVPKLDKAIQTISSLGTTSMEYVQSKDRGDLSNALRSISESLGAVASGTNLTFFAQSYNSMQDQMRGKEFDGLTQGEKMLISAPYALVMGGLEKISSGAELKLGKIGSSTINKIIQKTFTKDIPKDATEEVIKDAIENNLKMAISEGLLKVAGGALIEGTTEGVQSVAETAIKQTVNELKDHEYFQNVPDLFTADGLLQAGKDALRDAKLGALGGAIMTGGAATFDAARNGYSNRVDDNKFSENYAVLTDDNLIKAQKTGVKIDFKNQKISKQEAKDIIRGIDEASSIAKSIPESLSTRDKRKSFNLLVEKKNLTKEIAGKDEALVSKQKERINAINEELKAISNKPKEEVGSKDWVDSLDDNVSMSDSFASIDDVPDFLVDLAIPTSSGTNKEGFFGKTKKVQRYQVRATGKQIKDLYYATKESEQPKQEVSTESNISEYQGTESGQQEVGQAEGSERTTTQPEANNSDSNIPSEAEINYTPEDKARLDEINTMLSKDFNAATDEEIAAAISAGKEKTEIENKYGLNDIELKHGTPHDFNKFETEKIGTGEGAQAFGYGLYFTENSKIAKGYADKLSKDKSGIVYTVKIKNGKTNNWLEWREPVDASQAVELSKVLKSRKEKYNEYLSSIDDEKSHTGAAESLFEGNLALDDYRPISNASLYNDLSDAFGQNEASKIMSEAGIDGVKYNTRQGKGSDFNYVVFNPESITITKKETAVVATETKTAPKVKVEGKKARIERAKSIVAETPHQMAAQYLLNGGKISRGVLEQLFGNKGGKAIKGEILSRLNIYDKNSDITIDGIAHKLWEDNGGIDSKYDTQEIREAVEDVIANSPQFDKAADLVIAESNKAQSQEIDYAEAMMQKANEDEQAFKDAFTDEENAKLAEEMAQAEFDFSKMDDNVNASDILEDIKSKDKFEEFLNNLIDKTSGKNTMFDASIGIPIAVINASLRAIKASYVVSRDMALAIKEGYKKLVEDGYDQMSEDEYTDMVAKNIARSNKNIKESVDEYKSRGFKDSEIEATLRRTGYSDAEISNAINAYNAPRENQGIDVEQEVQFPIVDENRIKELDKLVKGEENIDKIVSKGIDSKFTDDEVREYLKAKKNLSDKDASEAVLKYYNKKEGVTVFKNPKNLAQKFSQSLVSFKKRMFSARRFMPIFMRNALEQRDANIAARLHEATRLTNTFTKMYEAYEGNKSELIRNFDAHLRGDYSVDLPVEFAELSNDMRNEIKSLQNELLAAGLLDISDVMKYENDFGMYLTRSYEIFDKKNYKKKIMEDLNSETYIKAMNVIRKQMTETAKQEAIAKNIPFEEALDNLSKNKLEDYLTKNDSEEYRSSKGREGSKDLSILKQRLDIPYEIRMLMGEYSDPGQNFARTVMSMTSLAANNKYLNDLKTLGEGKFFFSANDARKPITHNTLIAPKGSETFNPLNGMYTTPEIAEEFNKVASQSSDAMKTYMKVLSTVKWLKTIASVATHAKNVTSNIFLLIANGHINPKTIGQAYKDLRLDIHPEGNKIRRAFGLKPSKKAVERSHEKIKEYISAGVIKQSAGIGEIQDMFKDADFDTAFASRVNKDKLTAYDKLKKKGVQAKNFAEELYEAEDDFFKIVAYESEMSRYSKVLFKKNKKDLTEEEYAQLKEKVAEIVKNTFPTYSRVPGIVQMVRKSPIIGTFVAFQAESYRTAYNTMALGFKELSSANIEEKKIGIQRILGIGAYKSLSVALTSYFGVAIGTGMTGILGKILDTEDEEEKEKQMRLFVPEWSKDSDLMSLSLKDGIYTFIDQSASDPHGGINRAVNAFMKGGKEGFAEGFYSIVEPFIRPEMTASVLMGLKNNQDAYGERIYNKEADASTIANEVGAYLYKWIEPGTASSVRKIIKADDKGIEGVGQMTGFKPMKIDIGKQFFFKMKDMQDRVENIKDIYSDEYKNKDATPESIADKYDEANRKYEAIQKEISKYYNAAIQLGSFSNASKAKEYKMNLYKSIAETARLGKYNTGMIMSNKTMPLKKRFDKIER